MTVPHHPVGEVLHHLVPELHLLSEGEVVAVLHHPLHQLTQLRLYLDRVHRDVQVPHVSEGVVPKSVVTRECLKRAGIG